MSQSVLTQVSYYFGVLNIFLMRIPSLKSRGTSALVSPVHSYFLPQLTLWIPHQSSFHSLLLALSESHNAYVENNIPLSPASDA